MAILNKDDFFNAINARVGTDTSDESIKFIEDMTDTYNHLEQGANSDAEDWKKKYEELDASWKNKYKARFFSGSPCNYPNDDSGDVKEKTPENIRIDDLFK